MLEFYQLKLPEKAQINNLQKLLNLGQYEVMDLTPYFKSPEDQTKGDEEWLDAGNERELFEGEEFLMVFSVADKTILIYCDQEGMEEALQNLRFCNNPTVAQFFKSDPDFNAQNDGKAPLYGASKEMMEKLERGQWVKVFDKPEPPNFCEFYQEANAITIKDLLQKLNAITAKPVKSAWFANKLSPLVPEQKREHFSISHIPEQMKKFDETGECKVVQADELTVKFWM